MQFRTTLFLSALALTFVGAGCSDTNGSVAVSPADAGKDLVQASATDLASAAALKEQVAADKAEQEAADQQAAKEAAMKKSDTEANGDSAEGANPGKNMDGQKKWEVPTKPVGKLPDTEVTNKQVRLETTKGTIVFDLLPKEGPLAASNYVALARSGFYDGLKWHRVIKGFMAQGGDPQGTGYGGPAYKFEDDKVSLEYDPGIVAMANSGPDTNGSQFFIMSEHNPLPPSYSIFGRVTSGLDVVRKLEVGDLMTKVTVEDKK